MNTVDVESYLGLSISQVKKWLWGDGLPSVTELAEAGLEHRLRCPVPKKNTALRHMITAAAVDKPMCTERMWLGRVLRGSG